MHAGSILYLGEIKWNSCWESRIWKYKKIWEIWNVCSILVDTIWPYLLCPFVRDLPWSFVTVFFSEISLFILLCTFDPVCSFLRRQVFPQLWWFPRNISYLLHQMHDRRKQTDRLEIMTLDSKQFCGEFCGANLKRILLNRNVRMIDTLTDEPFGRLRLISSCLAIKNRM